MLFKNRRARRAALKATTRAVTHKRDIYTELMNDRDSPLRVFSMSISPAINGPHESKRSCPLYQYGLTGTMTWTLLRTLTDMTRVNAPYINEPHFKRLMVRCLESAVVDGNDSVTVSQSGQSNQSGGAA